MPPLWWTGRRPVSDDRLSDQLLHLVVYAPIGLALEAKELPPKLADRGRGQIALTRLAGKIAADRGQSEVRTVIEHVLDAVGSALGGEVPVSSTKAAMGHLVAACGAVEAIVALEAVRQRLGPPTRNLDRPDPDCAVRHIPWTPAALGEGVAVSNAFGFGGSNASVVVEAP